MCPADSDSAIPDRDRLPHAALDRASRIRKTRKIIALIGENRFANAQRVLEIGCGSGIIANTLSVLGSAGIEVHAVDVIDSRVETHGFSFTLISGTKLPFDDATFDLVISNHVIEHVGSGEDQLDHLREARRVLSDDGLMYLAVPNKWRLLEPHYRLPMLSWVPSNIADQYVRAAGRGSHYDCLPPSFGRANDLFRTTGFVVKNVTIWAILETLAVEFGIRPRVLRWIRLIPERVLRAAMPIMPTYIFLLEKVRGKVPGATHEADNCATPTAPSRKADAS